MRQLALALAASIALHAAVFAALPRAGGETKLAPAMRLTAAVDVEISLAGGAAPDEHVAAARFEPARRRRHPGGAGPRAGGLSIATGTATPSANSTATPSAIGTPTANSTADPGGAGSVSAEEIPLPPTPRAGGLSTTLSDLDLTAFFDRLERAAQRCAGSRPGEGRVRFCVGADGAPTEVSLVQTTGNFALDDAALHCVIPGAAPFPRTSRCLVVPLAFH